MIGQTLTEFSVVWKQTEIEVSNQIAVQVC